MACDYRDSFPYFLRVSMIGFVTSLSTILLLISGLPYKRKAFMWILVAVMWLTITSMAIAYAISIVVITPKIYRKSLSHTIVVAVIVWCSLMVVLLLWHTARLMGQAIKEEQSRHLVAKRIKKLKSLKPHQEHIKECLNLIKVSHSNFLFLFIFLSLCLMCEFLLCSILYLWFIKREKKK